MLRSYALADRKSLKQFGVHVAGQPYQKYMIQRTRWEKLSQIVYLERAQLIRQLVVFVRHHRRNEHR